MLLLQLASILILPFRGLLKGSVQVVKPDDLAGFLIEHDRVMVEYHSRFDGRCLLTGAMFNAISADSCNAETTFVRCYDVSVANSFKALDGFPAFIIYDQ